MTIIAVSFGKVKRKAKVFHFPALFSRKFAVFDGFAKKYREMSKEEFAGILMKELEQFGMIQIDEVTKDITIMPIAGKISGSYPEEFLKKETEDAGK